MDPLDYVKLIVAIIVVLLAAYYAIYFFASRNNQAMKGRQIRIRERFAISRDKTICLMEVGSKVYLFVMTNSGATLLDTFELSDFADLTQDRSGDSAGADASAAPFYTGPFPGLFNKLTSRLAKRKRSSGEDFASALEKSGMDELINNYSPTEGAQGLKTAKDADGLDELYRRIQNKRDSGRTASNEEEPDE